MRVAIITSSDSGYAGKREDLSGPVIEEMVTEYGYEVVHKELLPDDFTMLRDAMIRIADEGIADLILTTGGTGFSPRDIMPEATTAASERMVPGIPEHAVYQACDADQGCQRNPQTDADCKHAGKSEGSKGMPGIHSAGVTSWPGDLTGPDRRVRQKVTFQLYFPRI